MKKKSPSYTDDEIDLIAYLKIIWSGKITILLITIISFLIAIGYTNLIPNIYLNSLTINKSNSSEFTRLVYLTNSIKSYKAYQIAETEMNQIAETEMNFINSNQMNRIADPIKFNEKILNKFMDELMDYEEFLFNLKKMKSVREDIENLPIDDQGKRLFNYARSLKIDKPEIVEPTINDYNFRLRFTWNNTDEAKNIIQDTLNLTSNNLEKFIYGELERSLKLKKEKVLNKDRERINFLNEQSSIAKELNIIDNENSIETSPYYVRGYRAINKEIELIKNREYKKFKFFEEEINSLKKEKIQWVNYNIYSLKTKSLKDTKSILIKSFLFGLILSILFVVISNIFQSHGSLKKTN
jgi:LPS O-antigen subunit length determinant protein (WzzB/FepE family)